VTVTFESHEIFGEHYHEYIPDDEPDEYVESDAERDADDMGWMSRKDMK
jgi:hypothetical protein